MCPLPSHKSWGGMGSGSQTVPMTVVPGDREAPAASEGPDFVAGPGGGRAQSRSLV